MSEGREPRDCHSYFCCGARRIGHMFALISASDGTPIIISGPCWPFCVFVTFPLIIGISCLVIFFLILGETFALVSNVQLCGFGIDQCSSNKILIERNCQPNWILGIYIPSVLVVLVFLFCVSCRDPGLMERVTVRCIKMLMPSPKCYRLQLTFFFYRTKKRAKADGSGMSKLRAFDRLARYIVENAAF